MDLTYQKSAFCGDGHCVEIAFGKSSLCVNTHCVEAASVVEHGGHFTVHVRDSKVKDGPVLKFNSEEWIAFVNGVKAGQFDIDIVPQRA